MFVDLVIDVYKVIISILVIIVPLIIAVPWIAILVGKYEDWVDKQVQRRK